MSDQTDSQDAKGAGRQKAARAARRHARLIVTLLTVASALVTLASFGVNLPVSPFLPVGFDAPVAADTNGDVTAIADAHARRLLVLDGDRQLVRIRSYESLNSPIDAVTDVCVADDAIYVAGVCYIEDSDLIERERVIRYNLDGSNSAIVYQTESSVLYSPGIAAINDDGDAAVATCCSHDLSQFATTVSFVRIAGSDAKPQVIATQTSDLYSVFDAGYDADSGSYAIISPRGVINDGVSETSAIYLPDQAFVAIDVDHDGNIVASDDVTGNLYRISPEGDAQVLAEGRGYDSLHVGDEWICACDAESGYVAIYDLAGQQVAEFDSTRLRASLAAYVSVSWLARAFLAGLLLWVTVRQARQIVRGGGHGAGAVFASATVAIAMGIAIGFSSYAAYRNSLEVRSNEINTFADYLDATSTQLSASLEKLGDRTTFRRDDDSANTYDALMDIEMSVGSLCTSATDNDIGTYFAVYGKDDQGVFFLYDSASEHVVGTSFIASDVREDVERAFATDPSAHMSADIRQGSSLRDETQFRLVGIPSTDGTSVVGVIEIGSRFKSFEASVFQSLAQHVITLLVILLVVYISYVEIRECGSCLLSYQDLQKSHARDALAVLTRPFSFLVTTLSSIDAVMSTLIAKALLQGSPMASDGMMIALPAVMAGLGMAAGHAVYGFLGSRVELRRLMARGAALMAVGALCATFAVGMQEFWLYCAAKLAMAVPFGLLYTLGYALPRRAETPEVQALAAGGIKRTDTSAAAFGTVLGAYAAQNLGNEWVYVAVAVVSLVVMGFALSFFPANGKPLERRHHRDQEFRTVLVPFLSGKETLADAFCVMLPATLAAGYNSFLFPLYSSDIGLGTTTINNLCMLGQLVVFVAISQIEQFERHYGKWRVSTAAIGLLGVVFLLFALNHQVGWAVASIALVGVLKKASDGWKAMWVSSAHKYRLPTGEAIGAMFATNSIMNVVRPLLLGYLITLGSDTAPLVLGGICAVSAVAFVVCTRDTVITEA